MAAGEVNFTKEGIWVLAVLDEGGLRINIAGSGFLVDEAEAFAGEIIDGVDAAVGLGNDVAGIGGGIVYDWRYERNDIGILLG